MIRNVFNKWCAGMVCAVLPVLVGCNSVRAPENYTEMWSPKTNAVSVPDNFEQRRLEGLHYIADIDGAVGLADLVEFALAHSPTIRSSWQQARSAQAYLGQSESGYYPQLILSGIGSIQRSDANVTFTEIDTTSYGPSAQLNWLLLDFGGRSADRQSALQKLRAANFTFNKVYQDLVLLVQQSYFNCLSAQAGVAAAEDDLAAAEKTLESAEQKRDVGLGVELDVLQARADHDKALYNRENVLGELRIAQGVLAAAIGLPPDMEILLAQPKQSDAADSIESDLQKVLEEALAQRPDVAALRAEFKAAEAAVRATRSDRLPALNLGASANRYWNSYSGADMDDNDTHEYKGWLGLEWTIFDGMLLQQQQRAAEANRETARYKLQGAELSAGSDVWSKWHSYRTACRKLVFSQSYLENAQGAYDLAAQGYSSGLKNMIDLLNAQSNLAAARNELVQTQKSVWSALAELANAVGNLDFGTNLSK